MQMSTASVPLANREREDIAAPVAADVDGGSDTLGWCRPRQRAVKRGRSPARLESTAQVANLQTRPLQVVRIAEWVTWFDRRRRVCARGSALCRTDLVRAHPGLQDAPN